MTSDLEVTVAIPDEVIDEDRGLADEASFTDRSLKSAREAKAEAYAELNRFRWEMVVCEHGPQYSMREYGAAVGVNHSTIKRGADAWEIVVNEMVHDAPNRCAYAGQEHAGVVAPPTDEQTESHEKAKHRASVGEIKAAAIEALARHFDLGTGTIKQNHPGLVRDALDRLDERHRDVNSATLDAVKKWLDAIAAELHAEHKLALRREHTVKQWMAQNQGVSVGDIKVADVRKMVIRITDRMERADMTWAQAEKATREADFKDQAAKRLKNELAKKARLAVLELTEASAAVKEAAIKVTNAVRLIEEDSIPLTDDERELSLDDLNDAEAAIGLARSALTGNSGTDWDAALVALNTKGE